MNAVPQPQTLEIRRRLTITYSRRPSYAAMGRFGGGWQWKLGVQIGGRTMIVSLLVADLIFTVGERQ